MNLLLHQTAEEHAERTAVIDRGSTFTYADMERYSNAICDLLRSRSHSSRQSNICLFFDNTAEKLFSVEGVIKAGFTYVPFDIRAGVSRNAFIVKNVGGTLILTDKGDYQGACELAVEAGLTEESVIVIDDSVLECGCQSFCDHSRAELAYIIHTSGSTGKPKGVMIRDSGLALFCENILNKQYITSEDTVGVMQNFSFDFSIIDMFPAMLCGAAMVCVPEDVHRDIYRLHDFIDEMKLTVLGMPTALYAIGVDVTPSDYFNHITFDTFMEMLRSKSKVQAASEKLIRNEEDRYEPSHLLLRQLNNLNQSSL